MNMELYKMVKQAILSPASCRDGFGGASCASCMAEAVTHMLEDEFILSPKFSIHPLEEV